MTLPGDGTEYELLTEAAGKTGVLGMVCEVGCRLGGGIQAIIDGLASPRVIVSVDPWGGVPYDYSDEHGVLYGCGYDQKMMIEAFKTIPQACADKGHLWIPMVMEDWEFFVRFSEGVPIYAEVKLIGNEYAFVHLDGPHSTDSVLMETEFFAPRVPVGGAIAYDNWTYFDSERICHHLAQHGFEQEALGKEKLVMRRVV